MLNGDKLYTALVNRPELKDVPINNIVKVALVVMELLCNDNILIKLEREDIA